jgi:ribonuclease T1
MMEKITTGGFPMKKQLTAWLIALVMLFSLVGCGADAPVQDDSSLPQQEQQDAQNAPSEDAGMPDETAQIDEDGSYTTKDDVALYIHTYRHLPDNFITKKDAQALGWPGGSLEPYAPGKCIGGSRFGNYEGLLPEADGRTYTECEHQRKQTDYHCKGRHQDRTETGTGTQNGCPCDAHTHLTTVEGKLYNQDRVLCQQTHQHDQRNLHIDIVGHGTEYHFQGRYTTDRAHSVDEQEAA